MISFTLTDEQRELTQLARRFAREEMRPVAPEYDEKESFPRFVYEKAHRAGLITYRFPETYGGGGVDSLLTSCILSEELFWGCAGISTSFGVTALAAGLNYAHGEIIVLMEGITSDGLMADLRTRRALERTLELIGEAAARVSSQTRIRYQEIPWVAIIGQHNIIAHRYAAIDYGRLFATVTEDVPALITALERIVGDPK